MRKTRTLLKMTMYKENEIVEKFHSATVDNVIAVDATEKANSDQVSDVGSD